MQSKPPDDCFAELDAVFSVLSAELEGTALALQKPAPAPPLQLVPTPALAERASEDDAARELAFYEEAFDRLDALMANAGGAGTVGAHARRIPAPPAPARVPAVTEHQLWRPHSDKGTPLERLLGTLENLALIRGALEFGSPDRELIGRDVLAGVLRDARDVCAELNLNTARVRALFALEALAGERRELTHEIAELVRHIRHDAQSWLSGPVASDKVTRRPRTARKRSGGAIREMRDVAADAPTKES